jgi:hypothetical protein
MIPVVVTVETERNSRNKHTTRYSEEHYSFPSATNLVQKERNPSSTTNMLEQKSNLSSAESLGLFWHQPFILSALNYERNISIISLC